VTAVQEVTDATGDRTPEKKFIVDICIPVAPL